MSISIAFDYELQNLTELAPAGYIVALHIRFTSPLMTFQTYPREWADAYTAKGYALRDPLVAWGFSSLGSTRWSELSLPDPFGILAEAATFGLKYGASVSVGDVSSKTIASVARSDREYTDEEINSFASIIMQLHKKTEPPDNLTKAQIEALQLIADGDRHAAAAAKLNISESALKARLTAARTKLLARTTAEAIQRAKDYRLI